MTDSEQIATIVAQRHSNLRTPRGHEARGGGGWWMCPVPSPRHNSSVWTTLQKLTITYDYRVSVWRTHVFQSWFHTFCRRRFRQICITQANQNVGRTTITVHLYKPIFIYYRYIREITAVATLYLATEPITILLKTYPFILISINYMQSR